MLGGIVRQIMGQLYPAQFTIQADPLKELILMMMLHILHLGTKEIQEHTGEFFGIMGVLKEVHLGVQDVAAARADEALEELRRDGWALPVPDGGPKVHLEAAVGAPPADPGEHGLNVFVADRCDCRRRRVWRVPCRLL